MRRLGVATLPAVLILGLGSEWLSYRSGALDLALADLVVGWVLVGCGLVAWDRRRQSHFGPLMLLTGVTWFLGSLDTALLYLHRGPLVHALLTYPSGRLSGPSKRGVVAAAYADAMIEPLGHSAAATLALSALVAAAAVHGYLAEVGPRRRALAGGTASAVALGLVLGLGALGRLSGENVDAATLWAYEAVLVVVAAGLVADLSRGRWSQGAVTGLVVDLGDLREGVSLRDTLARGLGDRSLAIGYWLGDDRGYVDEAGQPVSVPGSGSGSERAVTRIENDGQPVAVLVHDRAVLDDPGLVDAVAAAARMAVETVRLDAEVRAHVGELEASRRRIVEAGVAQRRRLGRELHEGAEARLAAVSGHVAAVAEDVGAARARGVLADVEDQLAAARVELGELARGIHPEALTTGGLAAVLPELACRGPVAVEVHVNARRWPAAVELAVYFVCAEALANVAKYARASRARIDVEDGDGPLRVTVIDDGVGGADPGRGSGLRGLADRVEALGGGLSVESPPGDGTRLLAVIPTN
jgi:signal transduction histidine kinase